MRDRGVGRNFVHRPLGLIFVSLTKAQAQAWCLAQCNEKGKPLSKMGLCSLIYEMKRATKGTKKHKLLSNSAGTAFDSRRNRKTL